MNVMTEQDAYIDITVKLNNSRFRIESKNGSITVFVTERPQANKVNIEIIKNFEKMLGTRAIIAKGARQRKKTIKIEGMTEKSVIDKINQ